MKGQLLGREPKPGRIWTGTNGGFSGVDFFRGEISHVLSHEERGEFRKFTLAGRGGARSGPRGCPTAAEQFREIAPQPQRRTHIREQPRETVRPPLAPGEEAQQQMHEERGPHLPLHRVGAVAEKIHQLHTLFELFEEGLDLPAAAVEVADVVEPARMADLRIKHRDHVAPRTEGTGLGGEAALARASARGRRE